MVNIECSLKYNLQTNKKFLDCNLTWKEPTNPENNNIHIEIVDEMKGFAIVLLLELILQIFLYSVSCEKFLINKKDKIHNKKNRK